MTDHKPLPVKGYTPVSDEKVHEVNVNKELEERVLRRIDAIAVRVITDQRWAAIARTLIQQGFMALNRAVMQPQRISLPEDAASTTQTVRPGNVPPTERPHKDSEAAVRHITGVDQQEDDPPSKA